MKQKKADTFQVASSRNETWFSRVVVISCAAILLSHLISSYFPKERLWGINHLAYFSPYFAIFFSILGLLLLVPKINLRVQNIIKKLLNPLYRLTIQKHKYLYFAIFSFSSIAVFWLFRVKTQLLGDGYHLMSTFATGKIFPTMLTWEPLEVGIHVFLYKFLSQFAAVDPLTIYALVSYLAGMVFIFFAILTSDLLGKDKFEKVFVFSILVSMGSILLFLGYVEHYSLTYANILAYLYFALRYLKKGGSILPSTFVFILGCLLHLLTFCFFPSLVFLYLLKSHGKTKELYVSKKRMIIFLLVSLSAFGGIYFYVMKRGQVSSLLAIALPLSPLKSIWEGRLDYTLFSSSHLLDLFNEQLLLSPIGFVLAFTLIVFYRKKIDFKDRVFQFLLILIPFQLTFHFLVNPKLGAVRDWDMFFFTALGYTMLGIYLFSKLTRNEKRVRYIGTALVFTSLLSTLPWGWLNHNVQKSVKRIIDAVEMDPANYSYYVYIEEYLKTLGEFGAKEGKKLNELFREQFPAGGYEKRGDELMKAGNLEEAEVMYKEAVRIATWSNSTHHRLGICYVQRGKLDESILEFEKTIKLGPEHILAYKSYAGLGYVYLHKRQFDKALDMYQRAIKGIIDEKERVYQDMGKCYLAQGKLDEAISMYKEALRLNPEFLQPHIYLGEAYLKKGMKDIAIKEYKIIWSGLLMRKKFKRLRSY
jgi:tetratricopeptide (TPR) repeat protein